MNNALTIPSAITPTIITPPKSHKYVTGFDSGTGLTLQNNNTYKLIAYTPNGQTNIGSTNFFTYQINGTSAGWTATATAPSYKTCIYPSFASFNFNNTISASTVNTAVSTAYYQDFPVSNITNTQKLYLLQIPNPIAYEVFVENVSTLEVIALVGLLAL